MKKSELIKLLSEYPEEDIKELKKMKKDELQERYDNYTDASEYFPNGRDYDAEAYD